MEDNPFKSIPIHTGEPSYRWKEPKTIANTIIISGISFIILGLISIAIWVNNKQDKYKQEQVQKYSDLSRENQKLVGQYTSLMQGMISFLGHTNVSSITLSNNGGYSLTMNPKKVYLKKWNFVYNQDCIVAFKPELTIVTNLNKIPEINKPRLKSSFDR